LGSELDAELESYLNYVLRELFTNGISSIVSNPSQVLVWTPEPLSLILDQFTSIHNLESQLPNQLTVDVEIHSKLVEYDESESFQAAFYKNEDIIRVYVPISVSDARIFIAGDSRRANTKLHAIEDMVKVSFEHEVLHAIRYHGNLVGRDKRYIAPEENYSKYVMQDVEREEQISSFHNRILGGFSRYMNGIPWLINVAFAVDQMPQGIKKKKAINRLYDIIQQVDVQYSELDVDAKQFLPFAKDCLLLALKGDRVGAVNKYLELIQLATERGFIPR